VAFEPVPTLIFPDAVELVTAELDRQLPALMGAAVPVGNRVPDPRPDRFVRVRRTGGTRITVVTEAATIAIEAWALDVAGAEDLAQAARSVVHSMARRTIDGVPVYLVDDVGGPAEDADELSDQPVMPFSVAVHVRGHT
jgi:hypothetical protein